MKTTKSGAKGKGKQPAKPVQVLVKFFLTESKEIEALNECKKIARTEVSTKAVMEALYNYPHVLRRADGLNAELQKINREFERLTQDMEMVRRAFNVINGTAPKPKNIDIDLSDPDECKVCGSTYFSANGQCTECGTDKN